MSGLTPIQLVECPRDAMQGIETFVPTELKAKYINALLEVGFHTIDFGSFVSPKAIPQMKDTAEVLHLLELEKTASRLLAIVANERGAEDACRFEEIHDLGFPLSVNETFQQRNTGKRISEAFVIVESILNRCEQHKKQLVVYLSMAFGNPYGDPYHASDIVDFVARLKKMGVGTIAVSDTIGASTPDRIREVLAPLVNEFKEMRIGAHLHARPQSVREKVNAVFASGCARLDGALMGFGGCPMAKDDLTGNLATELIIDEMDKNGFNTSISQSALKKALVIADEVFSTHRG